MEYASNKTCLKYHDIFNYPLLAQELKRWRVGRKFLISNFQFLINEKQNFHFIKGRQNIIKKRLENEKYSKEKLKIAKKTAKFLSRIPTIKFIGITGALAMMNAGKNSDIDLMIITKQNTLWTTRLLCYWSLVIGHWSLRRPGNKKEKDMLCINLWLDESDLKWNKADRNIYTAHEIAQIVPLVNKNQTYEKLLYFNRWILNFWPNAVAVQSTKYKVHKQQKLSTKYYVLGTILEKLAFKLQYFYMRSKITREQITPTRAIFHPNDWGKIVLEKLSS